MAITSGFFDSVNGDRLYDADQMSNYFDGLISDGVYESVGDKFLVSLANNGMSINVGSGRAIIRSHWVKNDATTTLTLDPADVQLNRIDAVVLRLDTTARSIDLAIKKGTGATGTPSLPAITRTETIYELYLAAVLVNKGSTQPNSITDLRPSAYCGWVTGIIKQVDTSDLFTQYETAYAKYYAESTAAFDAYMASRMAAFNAWFSTLTKELTVNAGITKLTYRIENVDESDLHVDMNHFPLVCPDFDIDTDVLLLHVNGIYFEQPFDYEIHKNIHASQYPCYISFHRSIGSTADITYTVLRNVIGKNVLWGTSDVQAVSNGGVSNDIIAIASKEV